MRLQKRTISRRQNQLFGCFSLLSGMLTSVILALLVFYPVKSGFISALASFTPVESYDKAIIEVVSPKETKASLIDQSTLSFASEFTLNTLDNELVSLSDFRGQAVLINFWASWCVPCRDEMPAIQATYEAYKRDDLVVLGINMTYQDNRQNAEAFVEEYGITFPILLDETGEVTESYRVLGVPTSVFVNKDGVIVNSYIGAMTEQQLDTFVHELMADTS